MPRKDHLPRQTRQEHITLQPNRSIEFRVTDDFGSFSPPHWHDALEIIYILEGSSIVTLSDRTKTVLPGQFLLINSGRIHTARCPSTGNRSILMQIPDAFLANYLPDPSQLWFSIDYDSTNPEVQKNISQFRRLLLSMMQLHEEMPDGYLLTFQRELFTFLDLPASKAKAVIDGGYDGKTVVMGIRPENVHDSQMFIETSKDSVVECKINVYELLGAEVYLYFDCEGFPMTARVDPRTTARSGDTVKFALDMEKVHLFDKETEITITN